MKGLFAPALANLYYRWSKEFLEAGKKRLLGDTQREASSSEVTGLRKENARLKELGWYGRPLVCPSPCCLR